MVFTVLVRMVLAVARKDAIYFVGIAEKTIGLPQRLWVRLKLFKDLMLLLTLLTSFGARKSLTMS
jgi:hypothetical protein